MAPAKRSGVEILSRGLLHTVIATAALYLLFSCEQMQGTERSDGAREKVSICYSAEPLILLVQAARDGGFIGQEGLDASFKKYPSGKKALEAMFAGDCAIASVAETPIIFSSFKRQDFSIFATIGSSDDDPRIIARRDKGIERPEDLRGRRIATQKGSAVHFFLHLFLIRHGLSEKDVKIFFYEPDELPLRLEKGEIDAFSMREPYISKATAALKEGAVVFRERGLHHKTFNLVAPNGFIGDNATTITKLLRALLKAEAFVKGNPRRAITGIAQELGVPETEIIALWPDLKVEVSLEQSLLLSLEDEARWAIKNGLTEISGVPNFLKFVYLDGLKSVKPETVTIIH